MSHTMTRVAPPDISPSGMSNDHRLPLVKAIHECGDTAGQAAQQQENDGDSRDDEGPG
jgi:hypothetical protein